MTVEYMGKAYPSEEIMMYAINKVGDKRAVISSATQCTTDYFGWRNEFDDLKGNKEEFVKKHGFDFTDTNFLTKTSDSVLALLSEYAITDISEGFILAYLQSRDIVYTD